MTRISVVVLLLPTHNFLPLFFRSPPTDDFPFFQEWTLQPKKIVPLFSLARSLSLRPPFLTGARPPFPETKKKKYSPLVPPLLGNRRG